MMVIYEKRERIARLREAYMHCPMMTEKLSYSMDKRQRYLFLKGWFKSSFLPTTLQRRSYAYAYVLENMKPVISEDELIVGQPDFSELCRDEEKEAAGFFPIAELASDLHHCSEIQIEPYHKLGLSKASQLGKTQTAFSDQHENATISKWVKEIQKSTSVPVRPA